MAVEPRLLVLVGLPGCGKSRACSVMDSTHVIVSVDKLKQRDGPVERNSGSKEWEAAREAAFMPLNRGIPVVIDDVSPSRASRRTWRELAQVCAVPSEMLVFKATRAQCEEGIHQRGNEIAAHLQGLARYEREIDWPQDAEGFDLMRVREGRPYVVRVDIDGTLCHNGMDGDMENAPLYPDAVYNINCRYLAGEIIVVETSRNASWGRDLDDCTFRQLEEWGLMYDSFHHRPVGDIIFDDKAVSAAEWHKSLKTG